MNIGLGLVIWQNFLLFSREMETLIGHCCGWLSLLYKHTIKKHPVACNSRIQIKDICCITCPMQQVSLLTGDHHFTGIAYFLTNLKEYSAQLAVLQTSIKSAALLLVVSQHWGQPFSLVLVEVEMIMNLLPVTATLKQRYREAKALLQPAVILWHNLKLHEGGKI